MTLQVILPRELLSHYNDTGGEWTLIISGHGSSTTSYVDFDRSKFNTGLLIWAFSGSDFASSTEFPISLIPNSGTPIVRCYNSPSENNTPVLEFNANQVRIRNDVISSAHIFYFYAK